MRKKEDRKKQNRFLFIGIAAAIVVIAAAVILFWRLGDGQSSADQVANQPEESLDELADGGQSAKVSDWYNLPGYINGAEKDEEQIICGVTLPYQVQGTPIIIEGIGQYTGPFVEDGNDEPEANVLAIVVRNGSDADVEYAEVHFSTGDGSVAVFHI